MGRFFGLVRNEYVKILKKISTKVLIILLFVSAIALSAFMKILAVTQEDSYNSYMSNYPYEYDAAEQYQSQIDWLNETKPEGYEYSIKCYQFLLDNDITSDDDWRLDAMYEIIDTPEAERVDEYINVFKNNDWRAYCEIKLQSAQTAGDKWEYSYRLEKNIGFSNEFKAQTNLINSLADVKNQLEFSDDGSNNEQTAKLKEKESIYLYQLENGKYYNTANMGSFESYWEIFYTDRDVTFWDVFMMTDNLVMVVGLIIIVIAGGIVASEFHQGTIKFLLINPVKRWKILMSKYFTCITFGYILLILLFIVSIPAVGIINGFDEISAPYIYYSNGSVHEINSFLYAAVKYLAASIDMVVMASLAFAISSLLRSSSLAIGLSVFSMFAGSTITALLANLNQDWARFLIFANTDLITIADGNSLFPQHTVLFAVMVIIAYMAVFILTAWDGFTKRSV